MLVESALGVTAFVATLATGLFAVSLVDKASELLGRSPEPEPLGREHPQHSGLRWEPLALAPYPMKWPSEIQYERRPLPEMFWPSETWDDPYFGPLGNRKALPVATSLTGNAPLEVPRQDHTPVPQPEAAAERDFFEAAPAPVPKRNKRKKAKQREPALGSRMTAIALEQARRAQAQRQATPTRQRPDPEPVRRPEPKPVIDSGLPEAEVLRGWVDQYGLAGAVSKLRAQTGWDFQKAARHLAKQVSGR